MHRFGVIVAVFFCAGDLQAFPDGAPWGAADPAIEQNCASCHFDYQPRQQSDALVITGLPKQPHPGRVYEIQIEFADPGITIAGFQLLARAEKDAAGFFSSNIENVESVGASVRSTAPSRGEGSAVWVIRWHAPERIDAPIVFYLAASAANDDGSPFGDTIHLRSYAVPEI